jgi:hypothetical protein
MSVIARRGLPASRPRQPIGLRLATAAVAFAAVAASAAGPSEQDTPHPVSRIVAIGDVHGDFAQLVAVLRAAGLLDRRHRWQGGRAHLVQTGDLLDRGPDSRKVMDLLMDLEGQARRAGGAIHVLLGNHEVMNLVGDLRYVSAAEYEAFRGPDAAALRDRAFALLADPTRREDAAYRQQWDAEHPLGWVEHRVAFGPKGKYGRWLRTRDVIARIGDSAFLHGGISPKYAALAAEEINARVRREMADERALAGGMAVDEDGPLWYRGLARDAEAALAAHVDAVLASLGVRRIVIGHTVTAGAVLPRFGGKVILIDVGLSAVYGGPPAALLIEDGRPFALHRGRKLALPVDGNLLPYLEAAAALDPPPSPLARLADDLRAGRPTSLLRTP